MENSVSSLLKIKLNFALLMYLTPERVVRLDVYRVFYLFFYQKNAFSSLPLLLAEFVKLDESIALFGFKSLARKELSGPDRKITGL